jgi:hypothetical protein
VKDDHWDYTQAYGQRTQKVTPTAWTVLTALLGLAVTVLLFALNRLLSKIDSLTSENKAHVDTIWTLKLAVSELKGTARVVDRTLSGIPVIATRQEGDAP